MLYSYLLVALRNLKRNRLHSAINLLGLSVGMACFVLISGFVRFETSYDTYHEQAEDIYRVVRRVIYAGGHRETRANTGPPLVPILREELPGVSRAARLGQFPGVVEVGDRAFREGRFFFGDPEILQVLTMPLLAGDPNTALSRPFTVLLAPEAAAKYFGDADPVGKSITYKQHDFEVAGLLHETPLNSHFHLDFLASYVSLRDLHSDSFFSHWDSRTWTYVKLRDDQERDRVEKTLAIIADTRMDRESYDRVDLVLQPVTEIHLSRTSADVEMGRYRNPSSLLTMSALGIVILLIGCINYMSLATSRSSLRAREVGIRKVVGGRRSQLVAQFLGEAVLLSSAAMGGALVLVEILLPAFGDLVGQRLDFRYLDDSALILLPLCATILIGFIAGAYPALVLTRFRPAQVVKGDVQVAGSGIRMREVLVVSQFALSAILIILTLVAYRQHQLLTSRDLGFVKEHLVTMPLYYLQKPSRAYVRLKRELLRNPNVVNVTVSTNKPGVTDNKGTLIRRRGSQDEADIGIIYVDHEYARTLGLQVLEGRDLSRDIPSDAKRAVLVNKAALEALGAGHGVGEEVELFHRSNARVEITYDAQIVGVLNDFSHRAYFLPQAMVFAVGQGDWQHQWAIIRIRPEGTMNTVASIRETWPRLFPGTPLRLSFLDEDIQRAYLREKRWQTTFTCFAGLAVLISALGLFGLASFTAERRVKEIGIRKTMGASVTGLVLLLGSQFIRLVALANVIGWPIAYFAAKDWLQGYAYRIDLGADLFLAGGGIVLVIALLTVGGQAVKAALADPVKALRYE